MKFKSFAFPIGWAILIFLLCHLPGKDLPDVDILGLDKLVHFCLFAILSLSLFHSKSSKKTLSQRQVVFWVFLQIIYGVSLELYQGNFVDDRTADPYDAVANAIGVFIGFYLFLIIKRRNL